MASTLAAQLQELARQRPALPATLRKGGKPSLLYDFQRAADVDLPTIHDIASQGLDELIRLEPRFRPYRESLFSRASLDINPDLQTPDFLAKLDESIHGFCCLLCNFFLAAPAFKALEYLIRRYKANERNVDSLLTAALPYHSTNEFVRLVQVLALGPQGSLWGWMVKMQSSGASLPRDLLAQRCANDKQLLLFVCKAAGQLGSIPSGAQAALRPPSRTFLSFYAVLLCEVLSVLPAVSEDFLTSLLPFLLEGLGRGAGQDYRAATLMVVAELCSKATLGRDCIKVLLNSMFKHTEPMSEHVRTALLVAAHVAVTQRHLRTLSDKTLKYLSALPNAMEELCALAQRGNMRMGPLLVLLARSLAQSLCGGDAKAAGRCEADLLALAHAGVLEGEPAGVLATALLEGGCAAAAGTPGRASCQKLLRILDQRYPSTTDAAVNSFLEPLRAQQQQQRHKGAPAADGSDDAGKRKRLKADAKKGKAHGSDDEDEDDDAAALSAEAASEALTEQQRTRFDFVRTAFDQGGGGGALSAPCGGTMMTLGAALSAPQAAVRRMALQQLTADFQAAPGTEPSPSEPRPILASALSRLSDDDLGVVVAALGCSCLLHQLPPAALLDALQPLLHRLAVHLYGSEKLPGLKAAKRAALKAVSWLQHIGGSCAGGASEGEGSASPLLQRVVLQLLALLLPSRKDPRVAVEAAKALGAVGGTLFAGLPAAAPSLEALLRGEAPPAEDAAAATAKAAKGKKGSKAAAAASAPAAAEGGKPASKADRKAAAAAVEQRVVGAIAKHLAADPAGLSPKVVQLVQDGTAAAATSGDGADGAAGIAAIRAQHVLLLASHAAAAAVDGAAKAKAASAASLHRSAVQLSEMLLPYVSLGRGVAASDDRDWSAAFASYVTDASLPTSEHCAAAQSDIVSAHAVAVLGVLQANLRALPEATAASAGPTAAASVTRSLGLLASLGCSHGRLHDLPVLIVTRAVAPASRSSLLASLYSVTPSSTPAAPTPTATQCLALYTQARLAADSAATGSAKSAADVGPWLPTLLPALASPESAVRAAACDTVRTLWELLSSGKASAGQYLPADAAAAVCSAILRHRALICRDPDAAAFLIRGSLVGTPGAAAAAAEPAVAPTPSKKTRGSKAAAAASEPDAAAAAAAPRSGASLELPANVAASLRTFLVRSLPSCTTDPAGTSTAAALMSCLLPEATHTAPAAASTSASPAPAAVPSISEELYASAWAYLAAAVLSISEHPTATTPLQGELLTQLLRIFTPAAASAAISRGAADTLATLATAAELLPPPPSVPCPAAAVAALAAARAAAVAAVTPQLFALLPSKIASAVFTSLLVRYEGDPDEGVRAAARASLDALPLHASFLTPMLNIHSDAAAAAEPPTPTPAAKKSKKADGAAAAAPSTPAVALPALRDSVVALEFLQWRTGIDGSGQLVASCQAVLRKLKPVMGSIVAPLGGEAEAGPEADDAPAAAAAAVPAEGEDAAASEAATSSLAGYACTLSLQALTIMARDEPDVVVGSGDQQQAKGKKGSSTAAAAGPPAFDLELVVAMAREAPDSAVRNAALGLMATLAGRDPQAALSHVLQVLSVVNTSAALQDDEYSRSVCDTALAAVVPAWVAAGHGSAALWAEAAAALPALPPHRRLDVLLALLRALPKPEEGLPEGLLLLLRNSLAPPPQPQGAAPLTPPPATAKTPKAKSAKKAKVDAAAGTAPAPVEVPQGPPPSEWLPELASSLAMQVDLPVRLSCCARLLALALADSKQQPHLALPRTCVAFVTAQLRLKAALSAASAQLRRPDPDPALDAACSRLMAAALAQMQLLQPDAIAADRGSAAASPTAPASAASLQRAVLSSSKALYALFGALQGVMAADTYLVALLSLASHPSDKVKRRAIKLFTDKVRGVRAEIEDLVELPQRVRDAKLRQASEASAKACGMFAPLLKPHDGGEEGSGASPLTRQLALVGLAAIATEFGSLQHAALLAGVPSVLAATKDRHASVRASALAAVAALVRALGTRLVPVLPMTVSAAVAAADAAWGRLSRSGGGGDDVEMDEEEEGGASEASGDEDSEEEGEERGVKGSSGVSRAQAREEEAALELSSALACLNALVESLGGFLSPHLAPVLAILLNPRVLACSVAGCDRFAASIRARLPSAIPPRLLLPALYERLQPCVAVAADVPADGNAAAAAVATAPLVALLDMVGSAAATMEAKVAVQYHEHMFAFLLRALDVRQRRPAQLAAHGEAAIDLVEAAAVRALVSLVMKLSEARFKPLFLRLLEWASTVTVPETGSTEPGYLGRMVSLFAAVNALVDRLRSVLVPYYRYLMDTAVQHLGGDEEAGAGGKARGKKKQKRASSAAAGGEDGVDGGEAGQVLVRLSWLLRLRIVRALHRCFLHDTVSFIDADRFARLQPALMSQLDAEPPAPAAALLSSPHHTDKDLSAYLTLGPTTAAYTAPDGARSAGPLGAAAVGALLAMAVAANSDALWKPLNHAALMMTRSSSPRTRALALELVAQLVDRLREEYLVLLPEALPFFSELLEDVDASVSTRVREVVAQLEEISGEKLDEYLKV